MSADSSVKFIGLGNIVGADCDQSAIYNLELAVELNEPLMLSTLLRTETAAAEDENHWILFLRLRELPAFCGVVGELIIAKNSAWSNIISHVQTSPFK